uniref:Uncharacterized protein n=1 Tax=viral metagenome TaxID=1070528 RepID=A0A6C0JIA4_9ZZZZ
MALLPSNVLRLIKEYSKPITRPNWRNSKPIVSVYEIYMGVYTSWDQDDLHYLIYRNIKKTYWYDIYWRIKVAGLYLCCKEYNITARDIEELGIPLY